MDKILTFLEKAKPAALVAAVGLYTIYTIRKMSK